MTAYGQIAVAFEHMWTLLCFAISLPRAWRNGTGTGSHSSMNSFAAMDIRSLPTPVTGWSASAASCSSLWSPAELHTGDGFNMLYWQVFAPESSSQVCLLRLRSSVLLLVCDQPHPAKCCSSKPWMRFEVSRKSFLEIVKGKTWILGRKEGTSVPTAGRSAQSSLQIQGARVWLPPQRRSKFFSMTAVQLLCPNGHTKDNMIIYDWLVVDLPLWKMMEFVNWEYLSKYISS